MPFSSLFLSVGTVLTALSGTALGTKYQQNEIYTGKNWLDAFNFETHDLNNGFVNYVDEATARKMSLYQTVGNDVMFGVDGTETLDYTKMPGRKSVRLEGKKNYNHGLFVLDVKQIPGVCGMWPAFWSLGQEPWPVKGEIDIIEGVNNNVVNKYVLHTDTQCKVNGLGQSNPQGLSDCALDTNGASGCDVNEVRTNSFGAGFNNNQGGYYVMEWDSDAIRTWFFPRGSVLPKSLTSDAPDTSEFGIPAANFKGDCNIDQRFKDQRFIFTNNFCGDWAGNAYASSGCPMQKDAAGNALSSMDSCKKYVASNPSVFKNQFWKISSFKTYNKKAVVSSSSSASVSRSSSMSSSRASSSVHASSTPVSSSSIRASSTPVSSSSSHVSSTRASSSSVHASSTPASSSSIRASSTPVSSSSVHVSSTRVSSSSVHASSTPVGSSSVHASSTPVSSSSVHASSTPVSSSSHGSSTLGSSSSVHASSTPVTSSVHASSTPLSSSHVVSSSVISSSSLHAISSSIMTPSAASSSSSSSSVASMFPVSSSYYPGQSSSAPVYPSSSGSAYSAPVHSVPTSSSSSSSFSAYVDAYHGNFSAPITYSVPAYGGNAKSTPCTTSSVKGASSTPDYPVYPNSAPVYGDYPSYPVSSAKKNDYPYLPSFIPLSPYYPETTSAPVYGDYNTPSKTTVTTTYTTTYVDVCETGYITKTITFAVTYCPTTTPTSGKPAPPPTYGWDIKTTVCNAGCGSGPKTVTVTVPCTKCNYITPSTPTPAVPSPPPGKPACSGYDCTQDITITTKVYSTKIITLAKSPVPDTPKSMPDAGDSKSSKPVVPASGMPVVSKPAVPTPGKAGNGTVSVSVGTGVKVTPSKTGYGPPAFTGAAASLQGGAVVAVVGVAAAMFL